MVQLAVPAALTWDLGTDVLASAAFELGYVVTLAAGLARGDLTVAYPLARGSTPVLVTVVGTVALGASTSPAQTTGIALVAAGVLLVRGLRRPGDPRVIALALGCGACIAGYTLVDAEGIQRAGALPYLWAVMALTTLGYLPLVARRRGVRALRGALGPATVVAGVAVIALA